MPEQKPVINKMRHPKYARDEQWIIHFLNQADVGHIATRDGNQPYITPTLFWYSPEQHKIYFHSNITGQVRSNIVHNPEVCFEASRVGKLLPSNLALEFSIQYQSVIAFGKVRIIENPEEKKGFLYGLIEKYFPGMEPGVHYRPITDKELRRTSVYAIAIEKWSGKDHWREKADQGDEWPPLGDEWFR